MNINNFEKQISPVILERGKEYYNNGNINKLTFDGETYTAKVDGTSIYKVTVRIASNGEIVQSVCNCPYDFGNVCKHEAAVYYAIRDLLNSAENSEARIKIAENNKKNKPETIEGETDNLKDILHSLSKDELEKLMYKYAKQVEIIEKDIMYLKSSDKEKEKAAKALIREYINRYRRRGFIDYRNAHASLEGARIVLENAENEKSAVMAVKLCIAVLSIAIKIENIDDSDGCLGDVIYESFEIIKRSTADKNLSNEEKKQLFTIIINESENAYYKGWTEFKTELLNACIELCGIQSLRSKFEDKLDVMYCDCLGEVYDYSGRYLSKEIKRIKYTLVKSYDGETEARLFVNKNIDDEYFREIAVNNAIEDEDYEYALKLIEKLDMKTQNEKKWRYYTLKAYEGENDTEKIEDTLIKLITSGEIECYEKYKNECKDKWESSLSYLLSKFDKNRKDIFGRMVFDSTYIEILKRENLQEKMLEVCGTDRRYIPELCLYFDENNKIKIKPEFEQYILLITAEAHDRSGYKNVCRIIMRYKKTYGEEYRELVNKLRELYPRRPAFLQELLYIK